MPSLSALSTLLNNILEYGVGVGSPFSLEYPERSKVERMEPAKLTEYTSATHAEISTLLGTESGLNNPSWEIYGKPISYGAFQSQIERLHYAYVTFLPQAVISSWNQLNIRFTTFEDTSSQSTFVACKVGQQCHRVTMIGHVRRPKHLSPYLNSSLVHPTFRLTGAKNLTGRLFFTFLSLISFSFCLKTRNKGSFVSYLATETDTLIFPLSLAVEAMDTYHFLSCLQCILALSRNIASPPVCIKHAFFQFSEFSARLHLPIELSKGSLRTDVMWPFSFCPALFPLRQLAFHPFKNIYAP